MTLYETPARLGSPGLLDVNLALDEALRLFPVLVQILIILVHGHQGIAGAGHVEQPAGPVIIDVDPRRIIQKGAIECDEHALPRGEQVADSLRGLDVADLLKQIYGIAAADVPVEEVDVLHEADGVGGEAEAPAVL